MFKSHSYRLQHKKVLTSVYKFLILYSWTVKLLCILVQQRNTSVHFGLQSKLTKTIML